MSNFEIERSITEEPRPETVSAKRRVAGKIILGVWLGGSIVAGIVGHKFDEDRGAERSALIAEYKAKFDRRLECYDPEKGAAGLAKPVRLSTISDRQKRGCGINVASGGKVTVELDAKVIETGKDPLIQLPSDSAILNENKRYFSELEYNVEHQNDIPRSVGWGLGTFALIAGLGGIGVTIYENTGSRRTPGTSYSESATTL